MKRTRKDSTWAKSPTPVSTEIRPSQRMLGRGLLICGKSAGGCTELTQLSPVLGSAVLPKCSNCSHAALAACLQTRINAFPCSYQLHHLIPLSHSLHFREANMGFITKAAGPRCPQEINTAPCPTNGHYCSPHRAAKLPSPWSPHPCTARSGEQSSTSHSVAQQGLSHHSQKETASKAGDAGHTA